MKKLLSTLSLIFLSASFLLFAGGPRYTDNTRHCGGIYNGCRVIVTDNNINVRDKPGMDGKKKIQLNAGDIVTISEVCEEKMFVDGAWANWVLLDMPGEPCYTLSRWMTRYFTDLGNPSPKIEDYLAYEYFYEITEDFDPDWGQWEIIADNLIRIKNGKVNYISYPSFVPDSSNEMFIPVEMKVAPKLADAIDDDEEPIVIFRQSMKYGGGYSAKVGFYKLDKKNGFSMHVIRSAYNEGDCYKKAYINFEKRCYDVLNGEWVEHTSKKAKGGTIIITTEEKKYDEDGNPVIKKDEFNPEL